MGETRLATTFQFRWRVTLPSVEFMRNKRIAVQSSAGSYSVVCGAGVLRHAALEIAKLGKFSSVHIASSAKEWRALRARLGRSGRVENVRAAQRPNSRHTPKKPRADPVLALLLLQAGRRRQP